MRQLSKRLHTAAAQYAADGEVCSFQLITEAQEFLQEHNCAPDEEEAVAAAPQSLWHEMLQRDMAAAAAASREQSFRAPIMGDTFYDTLEGGGLFSDATELPMAGSGSGMAMPASAAAVPVVEVRSKQAARPPKPAPPRTPAVPAMEASVASVAQVAAKGGTAAAPAAAADATTAGEREPGAEEAPAVGEVHAAAGVRQASTGGALPHVSAADSRGSLKAGHDSGLSSGGGGSMLKTLGHSIRGVLPKALRRYVDGERLGGVHGCQRGMAPLAHNHTRGLSTCPHTRHLCRP